MVSLTLLTIDEIVFVCFLNLGDRLSGVTVGKDHLSFFREGIHFFYSIHSKTSKWNRKINNTERRGKENRVHRNLILQISLQRAGAWYSHAWKAASYMIPCMHACIIHTMTVPLMIVWMSFPHFANFIPAGRRVTSRRWISRSRHWTLDWTRSVSCYLCMRILV